MIPAWARPAALAWVPAVALAAGLLVALSPLNAWLSRPLLDWQLRLAAPGQPPAAVLVLDIDQASLETLQPLLGPWPYSRDVYGLVVEQLREAGARAVAIDLLLADALPGDAALARAIAKPGAPVVLAAAGLQPLPGVAGGGAHALPAQPWQSFVLPARSTWPSPARPPPLGLISTPLDDDGRLRTLPLWHVAAGQRLPTLPLALWLAQAQAPAAAGLPDWPVDAQGRVALAFAAPTVQPPVLPFATVAQVALGQAPAAGLASTVQDRVVFIGSSALLAGTVMTVQGQAHGTAVLAQAYAALRAGQLLRPPRAWAQALLLGLALLPALATWARGRPALGWDALAAALATLAVLAAGLGLLAWLQMPTPWAAALACLVSGLFAASVAQQQALRQTQRRLAEEQAAAAAANQAKSAFLAHVSHEIRTPLNALLGVAELLAETRLSPVQQRHVAVFRDAGQSLQLLINDLLDIAKIEAGHFELDPVVFSLPALLDSLVALQRPRAEQKGLQLRLVLAPGLPDAVLGDRQRLAQALGNLLANAVKFTASGQVELAVAPAPEAMAQGLRFMVSDSGIGIAPSKLAVIFEPFVQADGSVTRQHGGTGLGLAITRSLVQLMGGQVVVHSQPALGSVFTLTLPLPAAEALPAEAAVALAADGAPPPSRSGPGPRVLLAEDNEVNVYVFQAMLAGHCAVLDVASNGHAALALACQHQHDLVFMDWQMPGLDGLGVTRALRRHEASHGLPRLPVVALTANAYGSDQALSAAAGFDGHIAKPASKAQLLAALARFAPGAPLRQASPDADDSPAAATPGPAGAGVLDSAAALARLGEDARLLAQVMAHAAVFIQGWPQAFEAALQQGQADQARRLAHDLRSIAASIGADALSAAAAELEAGLVATPQAPPDPAALARLQQAIGPVLLLLGRGG